MCMRYVQYQFVIFPGKYLQHYDESSALRRHRKFDLCIVYTFTLCIIFVTPV